MTDKRLVRFVAPLPPVALRRNSETRKTGWKAALVRQYQEDVWVAGFNVACDLPWPKATLRLTWRYATVAPDVDNALASCKWLIDVLKATGPRPLGIFQDDSPDCLTVTLVTEKVATKAEEAIIVECWPDAAALREDA